MRVYNTMSRSVEEFVPIHDKEVGFYSCGPTVYWYQHIGNLRTYIFNDILKRTLIYNGFNVKHVMNVTDVGHLTSDADEGEDKIEKAAKREKKSAEKIAKYYADVFFNDCKKLNIIQPNIVCWATKHIKEQIEMVKTLEQKGFTYRTSDGIYFDTSKLDDYGKLARLNIEGLKAGKRIGMGEKRNKTDFALWKFSEKPGVRQQEWNPKDYGADWPIGFPGWHIECAAMSSKYLGEQFDLHTGGEDHIAVHHTNEIAEAESAFGKKPWVKYWMHGAFLTSKGEKVSKSTGGLFTISDLEKQGFEPLDYRYLCLNTHYRKQLNFSLEALENAKSTFDRMKNIILELKERSDSNRTQDYNKYLNEFNSCINDDLNTPKALGILWNVLRNEKLGGREKLALAYQFDLVFGLRLKDIKKEEIPEEIIELADKRKQARERKDWTESDKIRDEIKKKGYSIEDTEEGYRIRKLM